MLGFVPADREAAVLQLSKNVKAYTLGKFDLADVDAKPRRVVHTRLVGSREM